MPESLSAELQSLAQTCHDFAEGVLLVQGDKPAAEARASVREAAKQAGLSFDELVMRILSSAACEACQ